MVVNYIYNQKGEVEYAVIPYNIWDSIKNNALNFEQKHTKSTKFEPSEFIGLLSHYDFDIEEELKEMKSQWKKDIL